MVKVKVHNGNVDEALKKFKRAVKKDGILLEVRKREYYVKPGAAKRLKHEEALRELRRKQKKIEKQLARRREFGAY